MRSRPNPVEALATLVQISDGAERRASFRQAVTALGKGTMSAGPPPLDGIDPDVLGRAAQIALDTGLADDLDWLDPGSAAVALYEISAALPPGKARRELGRRVFGRLYEGTAATFATVASRMAFSSNRPFEASALRARVSLLFDLPVGSSVNADPLALTLVTRPELFQRWVESARTGTLPVRRLAAKLIEHASREAVLRAQQGDPYPLRQLTSSPVKPIFYMLLADREPLVWRHAAVARGLLAAVEPAFQEEIEAGLDEALTPTEWRRAGVSLVATIVSDTDQAVRGCKRIVEGPIGKSDPGVAATLIMGLPRVIEAEPDHAEELLDIIAKTRRPDVAEAVASLLSDLSHQTFGMKAAQQLRATLASQAESSSSVLRAVADRSLRHLDRSEDEDEDDLVGALRRAMLAFETRGARAAYELAQKAIAASYHTLDFIEAHDPHDEQVQAYVLGALSDVAASALERPRLSDLLLLGRRPGETESTVPELERLYHRLGRWLVDAERGMEAVAPSTSASLAEQRRLKALLHLVDVDTAGTGDEERVRGRMRQAVDVMLKRVASGPDRLVHRIACATLARAFDAAVRENLCEPSEVVLTAIAVIDDPASYEMLFEASTNPHVSGAIRAYADFLAPDPAEEANNDTARQSALRIAERIVQLSHGFGAGGSYHTEALRRTVLKIGRGLETVAQARGQSELVDNPGTGEDVLAELEFAIEGLSRLFSGAARRVLGEDPSPITVITDVPSLSSLIERSVRGGVPPNRQQLAASIKELTANLPRPLALSINQVLETIETLPVAPASDVYAIPLERRREALPDWLLPRRTIGAFYVIRALGAGGAASVFMARRLEDRNNADAEGFALKVPDYDPTTARSLSEQEFLQLFREEAGALISVPQHQNLARFVTFDLAARPKPILVMELIRGLALDRLVRSRSLSMDRVFGYLDGILAGLEAMHSVGIGHLDLKPSNVILRNEETPVLVDFGLSGRQLRPGCGTLEYCAPEVVGVIPKDHQPTPMPADVYAFGCLAFELFTTQTLFEGDDEMKILAAHVEHDGWPPKLAPIGRDPHYADLGVFLAACLRRDPRQRPTVKQARRALAPLAAKYAGGPWPLTLEQRVVRSA
jgi:hypothetical protein